MKKRIGVIYGGASLEHDVSLRSAAQVIMHLLDRYEVIPIGIDRSGRWYLNELDQVFSPSDETLLVHAEHAQKDSASSLYAMFEGKPPIDVFFPMVHGTTGEDGCLQGLFELMSVPYVGCGVYASALTIDKVRTKILMDAAGIPLVIFWEFTKKQALQTREYVLSLASHGLPAFVKPACSGSSIGIEKVENETQLKSAIERAFLYDTRVLGEEALDVRDIECAVLENPKYGGEPLVSVAGEIITKKHSFYSYEAKCEATHDVTLKVPADLSEEQSERIEYLARRIFTICGCEGMARIDFFIERSTGRVIFNEINTIPGFTKDSLYPKLCEASGVDYDTLLDRLIDLALSRHRRQTSLIKDQSKHQNNEPAPFFFESFKRLRDQWKKDKMSRILKESEE